MMSSIQWQCLMWLILFLAYVSRNTWARTVPVSPLTSNSSMLQDSAFRNRTETEILQSEPKLVPPRKSADIYKRLRPWPAFPFSMRMTDGYLVFNRIGRQGSQAQTEAMLDLMVVIIGRVKPMNPSPSNLLAFVPDDEDLDLRPCILAVDIVPLGTAIIPSGYMYELLGHVSVQFIFHGFAEVSVLADDRPFLTGRLETSLAYPPPMPEDTHPIFVANAGSTKTALEITDSGEPYALSDWNDIFEAIKAAYVELDRLPESAAFAGIRKAASIGSHQYVFEFSPQDRSARGPSLINLDAAWLIESVLAYMETFKPRSLVFNGLRHQGDPLPTVTIAHGTLTSTRSYGFNGTETNFGNFGNITAFIRSRPTDLDATQTSRKPLVLRDGVTYT